MPPSFRFIPTLGNPAKCDLQVGELDGISTVHGNANTDRGTVYVSLTGPSPFTVRLYADAARSKLIASGAGPLATSIALTAQNASGITGSAWLNAYTADDLNIVAVPSFATDVDVLLDLKHCQIFAGPMYDPAYGLAELHAQAMREIVSSSLPAMVPDLYGKEGLAPFVPGQTGGPDIPDLRRMASVGQLRQAQGSLVKALCAEQQEHLEEMAMIAKSARERYARIMDEIAEANIEQKEEAKQEQSNVSIGFGQWRRT